jgi:hypothetical protein
MNINSPEATADRGRLAERLSRYTNAEEMLIEYLEGLEDLGVCLTFSEKRLIQACVKLRDTREDEHAQFVAIETRLFEAQKELQEAQDGLTRSRKKLRDLSLCS